MNDGALGLFISLFAALFSIVNPLGAMPMFLSMTTGYSTGKRNQTARKASFFLIIILAVSFFLGNYIINFFGISIDAMRIAGGIIILFSGYSLLQGNHAKNRSVGKKVEDEGIEKDDISLTPLAMPLLAGPGSISLLIGYSDQFRKSADLIWMKYLAMVIAIVFVGIGTYVVLRFAPKLVMKLGEAGMNSLSRIIGFIVMSVGVQFIINGVSAVVKLL